MAGVAPLPPRGSHPAGAYAQDDEDEGFEEEIDDADSQASDKADTWPWVWDGKHQLYRFWDEKQRCWRWPDGRVVQVAPEHPTLQRAYSGTVDNAQAAPLRPASVPVGRATYHEHVPAPEHEYVAIQATYVAQVKVKKKWVETSVKLDDGSERNYIGIERLKALGVRSSSIIMYADYVPAFLLGQEHQVLGTYELALRLMDNPKQEMKITFCVLGKSYNSFTLVGRLTTNEYKLKERKIPVTHEAFPSGQGRYGNLHDLGLLDFVAPTSIVHEGQFIAPTDGDIEGCRQAASSANHYSTMITLGAWIYQIYFDRNRGLYYRMNFRYHGQ